MGGRSSKQKGNRGEYLVRDYFRNLGYTADRVPSSGAAEGFKGDVKVIDTEGNTFLVEVKSRQNNFASIYSLIGSKLHITYSWMGVCVDISYRFLSLSSNGAYPQVTEPKRTLNKIHNMQKLLKGCQYLVVKDNNKPLLFIRYT